jgi:DNA-binding SARP family transcriptional activator
VLEFRILGPVEVWDGEKAVALGGQRQRAVLALLAIHVGEVVPSERLITYLWGESPPPTAATSLQNAVSQLRKALGADVVETRAPGYALNAKKDAVDARRFEQLVNEARSAEADRRAGLVDEALQMCVVRLSATSRMSPLPRTRRPGSRSFG